MIRKKSDRNLHLNVCFFFCYIKHYSCKYNLHIVLSVNLSFGSQVVECNKNVFVLLKTDATHKSVLFSSDQCQVNYCRIIFFS